MSEEAPPPPAPSPPPVPATPGPKAENIVIVTGDVVLAWDLLHPSGTVSQDIVYGSDEEVAAYRQSAGAWHMSRILEAMLRKQVRPLNELRSVWEIRGIQLNPQKRRHRPISHAYHVWTEFPASRKDSSKKATRLSGYMGTQKAIKPIPGEWLPAWPKEGEGKVRLVVVTDDDMGYRDPKLVQRPDFLGPWLSTKGAPQPPWVLWKQREIDERFDLLHTLSSDEAQARQYSNQADALYARTIAVVSSGELRKRAHRISADRAWEGVAEEAFDAVLKSSVFSKVRWVVVSFATVGALIVEPTRKAAFLLYDPTEMEGSWMPRFPGNMVGLTTCIVADIAKRLIVYADRGREVDEDLFEHAIIEGTAHSRRLHRDGYHLEQVDSRSTERPRPQKKVDAKNPTTTVLTRRFSKDTSVRLARAAVPPPGLDPGWAILKDDPPLLGDPQGTSVRKPLEVAMAVVREGPQKALRGIPRATYGKLLTADRHEIDALRAIFTLLLVYLKGQEQKPLSLGVFGPPGAGKSYAVKQLAKVLGEQMIGDTKTFNLSQFNHPDMLIGAFHQIRDVSLRGKPPLVFWDEFDTSLGNMPLGWLRYFLAPMQDGEFQEGQITHPIGRAVFVFAGGTSHSMKEFGPPDELKHLPEEKKAAKHPDFVSRLRGFLDVRGINPRPEDGEQQHLIRRAIVLHGLLGEIIPNIVLGDARSIDEAVLRALLTVGQYKHGTRSLESILRMSNTRGEHSFTQSCLPSASQLDLHVDSAELLRAFGP